MTRRLMVSVIGGHECDETTARLAEEVGRVIALNGAALVCGGLEGVMQAVCRGARSSGGLTVGLIPGREHSDANEHVGVVIPTGMGFSRNTLVAGCADMVVALKGSHGTLSEICFAIINLIPVYSMGGWDVPGVRELSSVDELERLIRERKEQVL